jgi:hypothetical protein
MIAASGRKSSGAGAAAALSLAILLLTSAAGDAATVSGTKTPAGTPASSQAPPTTKPPTASRKHPVTTRDDAGKVPANAEKPKTPAAAPELRPDERKTPAPPTLKIPSFPEPRSRSLSITPEIDTSKPPPLLPRAPRERMRVCAEEWIQLKHKSRVGLPMWRDFAAKCLTRQGVAAKKTPGEPEGFPGAP